MQPPVSEEARMMMSANASSLSNNKMEIIHNGNNNIDLKSSTVQICSPYAEQQQLNNDDDLSSSLSSLTKSSSVADEQKLMKQQQQSEECSIKARKPLLPSFDGIKSNSETVDKTRVELKQQQQQQQKQKETAPVNNGTKESFVPSSASRKKKQENELQPKTTTTTTTAAAAEATTTTELGQWKKLTLELLLTIVKTTIALYDLVSQPICYIKHKVYARHYENEQVKLSTQINSNDPNSPWRQAKTDARQLQVEAKIDSFETYDDLMRYTFDKFSERPCYGYRSLLDEQWIKRSDSDKLQRRVCLTDYKWISFAQFERQIEAAKRGFLLEGVKPGDKVMLYADTRPEWQISSQALIRLGAIVGTMYATLGVEGIVHSVNETQVSHVVAQKDKVNRLLKLKPKLPLLKRIIYLETSLELPEELGGEKTTTTTTTSSEFEHSDVKFISFSQLLARGVRADQCEIDLLEKQLLSLTCNNGDIKQQRNKDSVAVIMYTSGSTGIPKGVLISHRNIMATIKSFSYVAKDFAFEPEKHTFTAYLPLAHIFEFCFESLMLVHGIRYGFATPHTLTDKSPGLAPGQKGDLSLLKPTILIIVPLILDRIVQGIKQTLSSQSYFKRELISYLIKYKIYWQRRYYETPIVDKVVCSKMAIALGGQAKYVISGSAPLSGETQTFVRAALNLKLPQGFGTTETCAATSCQTFDDQSTGNVGLPVANSLVKLEPWEEGDYLPNDKPNPRGEIVVGGEMIAQGYYKLDEQTAEAFYVDEKGIRWYRTGDIGEFLPNGNLKIIDRKKDLVKLQNGEYISLGKIESTLKSNPYTENFCIYANSAYNYVIALGPANEISIRSLAQQIVDEHSSPLRDRVKNDQRKALLPNKQQQSIDELRELLASYDGESSQKNNEDMLNQEGEEKKQRKMSSLSVESFDACTDARLHKLCSNELVEKRVLDFITSLAHERNLANMEIPRKLFLIAEEWTEDKNVVTAAMKIRRNYIYKRYEHQLNQLYETS